VVDGAVLANLVAIGKVLPHLIPRPVLNSFYSHNLCVCVCARVSAGVCAKNATFKALMIMAWGIVFFSLASRTSE